MSHNTPASPFVVVVAVFAAVLVIFFLNFASKCLFFITVNIFLFSVYYHGQYSLVLLFFFFSLSHILYCCAKKSTTTAPVGDSGRCKIMAKHHLPHRASDPTRNQNLLAVL